MSHINRNKIELTMVLSAAQKEKVSAELHAFIQVVKANSGYRLQIVEAGDSTGVLTLLEKGHAHFACLPRENIKQGLENSNLECLVCDADENHHSNTPAHTPEFFLFCQKSLAPDAKDDIKDMLKEAISRVAGSHSHDHIDSLDKQRASLLDTHLRPQVGIKATAVILGFLIAIVGVIIHLKIDISAIFNSFNYFVDILGRMLPPDFSDAGGLIISMLETIEIGFLGTVLAVMLSTPLSLMSAKNIVRSKLLYYPSRLITTFFRAVPEFIIAMVLVISVGFGALPGVLALALHTMGFLSKFYAEEIEHVKTGPIEAIQATGANWFQKITYAVLPQILPSFIGNTLYIFDRNIRMATMLGIVGAGGIGYRLLSAFRMFRYKEVSAIIIIIFLTIFFIDLMSSRIRHMVK